MGEQKSMETDHNAEVCTLFKAALNALHLQIGHFKSLITITRPLVHLKIYSMLPTRVTLFNFVRLEYFIF